jgi:hypothetical protein
LTIDKALEVAIQHGSLLTSSAVKLLLYICLKVAHRLLID